MSSLLLQSLIRFRHPVRSRMAERILRGSEARVVEVGCSRGRLRPLVRAGYTGLDENRTGLALMQQLTGQPGDIWYWGHLEELGLEDDAIGQVIWWGALDRLEDQAGLGLLQTALRASSCSVLFAEPVQAERKASLFRSPRRTASALDALVKRVGDPILRHHSKGRHCDELLFSLRPL